MDEDNARYSKTSIDLNHVRKANLAGGERERSEAQLDHSCGFSAGTNKVMMTPNTPSENPLKRSALALVTMPFVLP
jgi:hypothetical protein